MILRPMDTGLKIRMSPCLGLYVIANLLRNTHDVIVESENVQKLNLKQKVDLVGISVTVDTLDRAIEIAQKYKALNIPVIAGGIHISACAEECLQYFDAVCAGPCETVLPQMINDLQSGNLQKIYYCKQPLSAENIVSPAYDLIKNSKYLYCNIIFTSYGCPYKCKFCYNSCEAYKDIYVQKPIEQVLSEIKQINRRHVMFIDDNFIGNPTYTMQLLQAIKPLKIKWNAAVSANIVDMPDLLDEMQVSGCQGLFIGFESLRKTALENVNKYQNQTEKYEKLVYEIHKRGIMINASFVFGLDGDDKTVFDETVKWIIDNKIETVTSHILTPYPGTELYEKLLKENRITCFDYSKYNTSNVVFIPQNMTAEELRKGYLRVYKKVYSFKNIFKRIPAAKKQRKPYLFFNFFYRKFGKFSNIVCQIFGYKRIAFLAAKMSKYEK